MGFGARFICSHCHVERDRNRDGYYEQSFYDDEGQRHVIARICSVTAGCVAEGWAIQNGSKIPARVGLEE